MGTNGQYVGYVFLGFAFLCFVIGYLVERWETRLIAKERRRIARRDALREQMLRDDANKHKTLRLVYDGEADERAEDG